MSLFQFDTEYEPIYEGKPIAEVPKLILEPRGSTAMWDAIGRTIVATGARLLALPEEKRPGAVIVLIITDGHENASKEFRCETVKLMVLRQKEVFSWQFAYLGSDPTTHVDAAHLGTQSMSFSATEQGVARAYDAINRSVRAYRVGVAGGQSVSLNVPKSAEDGSGE